MKTQILVKRYANGLVDSIQDDKEFSRIFKQIESFRKMVISRQDLSDVLLKPFIPKSKAKKVAEELLKKVKTDQKVIRFLLLLIENERIEMLDDILKILPKAWNEKKGILTLEVSTAVPLKKDQKNRLQKKLEKIEKKPVWLKYKIDKEIIGGLSIRKENTFFDVSMRGDLMKLSEKIKQG
ncbi:MAG TPA: ATP synthase F1 subunit delta [Acidobacteriota bacterium]|nr:ATP synthase F1 subunit delta [Acidobacteriota bacterium]